MSAAESPHCAPAVFGGVTPVFRVSDLDASLDYYVNKLGFKINFRTQNFFASVARDRCNVFLSVGDQGHFGTWVWIGVGDVELVHNELIAKGAKVRHPPTNYPWALEMQVEDPDGNILRIGSEPKPNEPYGPWLDMNGNRWVAGKSIRIDD